MELEKQFIVISEGAKQYISPEEICKVFTGVVGIRYGYWKDYKYPHYVEVSTLNVGVSLSDLLYIRDQFRKYNVGDISTSILRISPTMEKPQTVYIIYLK